MKCSLGQIPYNSSRKPSRTRELWIPDALPMFERLGTYEARIVMTSASNKIHGRRLEQRTDGDSSCKD